jgi:transposase
MELSFALLELIRAESRESRAEILKTILTAQNGNVQIITLFLELLEYAGEVRDDWDHAVTRINMMIRKYFKVGNSERLQKVLKKALGINLKELPDDYGVIDLFAGMDNEIQGLNSSDKDGNLGETSDNGEKTKPSDHHASSNGSTNAGVSGNTTPKKGRNTGSRNVMNLDDLENNPLIKKIDIPDKVHPEEQRCPLCGTKMNILYDEVYSKELSIEVNIGLIRHHRNVYACPNHENHERKTSEIVRPKAQHSKLLSHSACSNRLLATIIWLKCSASLPLYRQERIFCEWSGGFRIPCKSMSSWIIEADEIAFRYVVKRLLYHLKQQDVIHVDETPLLVLRNGNSREDGTTGKSYLWAVASSKWAEQKIAAFAYFPGRAGAYADELLEGFNGAIETDEYAGYNHFAHRLLCWIHLNRKFKACLLDELGAYKGKEPTRLAHVLLLTAQLFNIEKECNDLTAEQRLKIRQEKSRPVVEDLFAYFHRLVDEKMILPKSNFMAAVKYGMNYENDFKAFLENGNYDISNNTVESNIRLIAVGRKNWMLSGSPAGARALADCYTMVETAAQNGLNPVRYLQYVLDNIRKIPGYRQHPEKLDSVLLPWLPEVEKACKAATAMQPAHAEENCEKADEGCHESAETDSETSAGREIINGVINGVRSAAIWLRGTMASAGNITA